MNTYYLMGYEAALEKVGFCDENILMKLSDAPERPIIQIGEKHKTPAAKKVEEHKAGKPRRVKGEMARMPETPKTWGNMAEAGAAMKHAPGNLQGGAQMAAPPAAPPAAPQMAAPKVAPPPDFEAELRKSLASGHQARQELFQLKGMQPEIQQGLQSGHAAKQELAAQLAKAQAPAAAAVAPEAAAAKGGLGQWLGKKPMWAKGMMGGAAALGTLGLGAGIGHALSSD